MFGLLCSVCCPQDPDPDKQQKMQALAALKQQQRRISADRI